MVIDWWAGFADNWGNIATAPTYGVLIGATIIGVGLAWTFFKKMTK